MLRSRSLIMMHGRGTMLCDIHHTYKATVETGCARVRTNSRSFGRPRWTRGTTATCPLVRLSVVARSQRNLGPSL